MVNFAEMSHGDAKKFLELFLARTPERLEDLRRHIVADGGVADPGELDLGPESLGRVWDWARTRLSWREGYQPPPLGKPGPRRPVGELEPADQLPEWFDPEVYDWWQFSASTLWLIDGVARYLGECILHAVQGSGWTVGRSRRKGYVFQNHPVIAGLPSGDDMEPMAITSVVVSRALQDRERPLRSIYEVWTGTRKPS